MKNWIAQAPAGAWNHDNHLRLCSGGDKAPSLPPAVRLPINHCNLPASVLGGLAFQRHPQRLVLDGVAELHHDLLRRLRAAAPELRAEVFRDYLTVHFRLERPEEMGLGHALCQHELGLRHPGAKHVTLYRGVNRMADHEILARGEGGVDVILLNNLSSFTASRERACEFGDYILTVDVPLAKVFFHCGLLPGVLQGEDEFLVIGGVVEVSLLTW